MLKRLQNRAVDAQPTWLRTMSLLCLLLVAFSSTAQSVHVHGQWLPHQQTQVDVAADASQSQSEASCPICVAMHSTLPVAATIPATEIVVDPPMRVVAAEDRVPDETWHFARFSRPPPVVETI